MSVIIGRFFKALFVRHTYIIVRLDNDEKKDREEERVHWLIAHGLVLE